MKIVKLGYELSYQEEENGEVYTENKVIKGPLYLGAYIRGMIIPQLIRMGITISPYMDTIYPLRLYYVVVGGNGAYPLALNPHYPEDENGELIL